MASIQKFIFLLSTLLCALCCEAQQERAAKFTMKDGLPSDVVYQTLEDDKGFLWVATDQGIARFDGRKFQVFGKKEGVPDIEVLKIVKEKNGRLWIRCYDNSIAYFDSYNNKFVNATEVAELLNIKGIKSIIALPEGGIQFETETGSAILEEWKDEIMPQIYCSSSQHILQHNSNATLFSYTSEQHEANTQLTLFYRKENKEIEKRIFNLEGINYEFSMDENKLYIFKRNEKKYTVISNFTNSLQTIDVQDRLLMNEYYGHNFTENTMNLLHRIKDAQNGKDIMEVNVYDKKDGKFETNFNEKNIAFHRLNDNKGNDWISTLDAGLLVYRKPQKIIQLMNEKYNEIDFYSVTIKQDGTLLAGNEKGEIIERKNGNEQIHTVLRTGKIEWQRNIVCSQNKVFTFSDGGIFVNYEKEILNVETKTHQESKAVLALNDSSIIAGSLSGLCKINTIFETCKTLNNHGLPAMGLASINHHDVYFGSMNGLYVYQTQSDSCVALNTIDPLLKERIVALCTTKDSLLWIATATNGIVVLKDNQVISHITEAEGLITNNTLAITEGKNGQVWIGTNAGICKLIYTYHAQTLNYTTQNISAIDGLSSNLINQMKYYDGHLHAATDMGISVVPDSVEVPEIKIELTGVKINHADTVLTHKYSLNFHQKNINLQFAGAELNGYFKQVEYSTDNGLNWSKSEGGEISLEWESGIHTIMARAVDVNKHSSKSILVLQFDIATPFWKTWWFWTIITLLIQLGVGYALYRRRRQKEKEKQKIESTKAHLAALEQQAFTSLMNPHFMFNSLNSIQHYINHQDRQNANRYLSDFASLIRKNFEAAQQAFIPLEQELENIGVYLRLERMRFNDKFTFEILADKDLEVEDWMMPTMILQPLVENAILHGIMPSKIQGELLLKISETNQELKIEVIDNGIGVENSRALKQGSKHRSRGMELIHKRLHALSFFSNKTLQLEYTTAYHDIENPGNKITLCIPYDLYKAWLKVQTEIA